MAYPVRILLLLLLPFASFGVLPGAAEAITIEVAPSGVGSIGTQVTFTVAFAPQTNTTGYDLTVAWDSAELMLQSSSPIFGGFFAVPPDPGSSDGTRVASLALVATGIPTTSLFSLTFDVLAAPEDALFDDFRVFVDPLPNGPGVGVPVGATIVIENPFGIAADVRGSGIETMAIPEPGSALLLAAALFALAFTRRATPC
jgi:hypothetical protein